MLQAALLLLGCALSRYLWGINITVASVVLGVTSSGIILYIFIVVAGAGSESCPYQTPGSNALRYARPKVRRMLDLATPAVASFLGILQGSAIVYIISRVMRYQRSRGGFWYPLGGMILGILPALIVDVYYLGRAMIQILAIFPARAYRLCPTIAGSLVSSIRGTYNRSHCASPILEQALDQQNTVLDLRCIYWMLQTSLDKAVRLSTLKHLAMIVTFADFNPTLVADCFSIFIACINVSGGKAAIIQGLEQLATVSAACFLRTFHHLSVTDPTSSVLADVRRRYGRVFPPMTDFTGLPFHYTVAGINILVGGRWDRQRFRRDNLKPSAQEYIVVARVIAEAARVEFQNTHDRKVPRSILHFALHSLSLDPPPLPPVIADCLSIIAIDLGCDVPNIRAMTSDERCVHVSQMAITLTSN